MTSFKLRPWEMADAPSLAKYANNFAIAKNLTGAFPHPYTLEHAMLFITKATSANPVLVFAIEIDHEAVGGIGLHPQHDIQCKNAELGYWLAEKYWGKGIITSAINQMVAYGFFHLDINRIFARPFGSNIASQRVLVKCGFKEEARLEKTLFKNGIFEDECIFAIRK